MTPNFKILMDYKLSRNSEEIFEMVGNLENKAFNRNFDYVFMDGRKVIELIMLTQYESFDRLDDVIQNFTKTTLMPIKVKNALFQIKARGNDDAHIPQSDKAYAIKADIFATVELLKYIFIVVKFMISNEYGNDFDTKEYDFDSSIYLPESDGEYEIASVDVSPETESLESKLKGIFALISSDYSFLIPTYQREYTWKEDNVNIFLQDIKDRSKDKQIHYMGSLAIAVDSDNKLLRLIDGQQRITTSLLLIKAIYERYSTSKSLAMPMELEELNKVIHNKYRNNAGQYGSLNHVKRILSNNISGDKAFLKSHAFVNYTVIKEFVDEMKYQEFEEFYTTFVFQFVISELRFKNELGQEIQIFENLNSKGMELSQWDLIKNYIYKNASLELLIEKDSEIEAMLNQLFVIPAQISFGKKKYAKLSEFFIFYSRTISKLLNGRVLADKGKIHKIFSQLWPQENSGKFDSLLDLRESLMDISKYFDVYRRLDAKEYLDSTSPLFQLRLNLENLSEKTAHYSLVMHAIIKSAKWNGNEIESIDSKSMQSLLMFISDIDKYVTRLLVSNNTGQSLPGFFDGFINEEVETSHELFLARIKKKGLGTSLVDLKTFKKDLATKNDWQKAYALSVLRTFMWDAKSNESKKYTVTIKPSLEHVFPQTPNQESEWFVGENISSWSRFKEKHDSRVNKLGNYLILSQSINSKASNNDYKIKLKHYLSYSDDKLLEGTDDGTLVNLKMKSSFTLSDIDDRTKQLAQLIAPLYKLSNE